MLYKYITVVLASTLKFLGGPLAGLALGLNWIETALCSATGMMLTVTVTLFVGQVVWKWYEKKYKPKIFSRRSRYVIRIWKKFGLAGIAFFTPLIFTPAGGTLIAISFKVNRSKIIFSMLISAILWAFVQSLVLSFVPI